MVPAATYSEITDQLCRAAVTVHELGDQAKIAIIPAAGRIVAIAFSANDPTLLWSHPQLADTERVKNHPAELVGGFGGERVWLAPELTYFWDGRPNWRTFENYHCPAAIDPGAYTFVKRNSDAVTLHTEGELLARGTNNRVGFTLDRTIHISEPPIPRTDPILHEIDYLGVECSHLLTIAPETDVGVIGLWHLLQVPTGSTLIVPTNNTSNTAAAKPVSYGLPGGWTVQPDHVRWRYEGHAHAKFGLSAAVVTGRAAVVRQLGPDRCCILIREFPVLPDGRYGDHPYGVPRNDQVFQAWDGYGFGEMEYHSTLLDATQGPRELRESDRLWAFGGPPAAVATLAARLLGVQVDEVVAHIADEGPIDGVSELRSS